MRDLDIVIYGATGYVGRLIAGYLAAARPGIRVGLAGRDAVRLEAVRQGLPPTAADWPVLVAALDAPEGLAAMAQRTTMVLSTVGPYTRHGLPVVAACAATGTDYADLTGEVPFVRSSIDRFDTQARDTGARIVHSCGFDSIPSDLAVYALHRRAAADGAGDLCDTTMVLRDYSGGYAGGSVATMVELMRLASGDGAVRRMLDDPYSLSPDRAGEPDLGPQPDLPLRPGAAIAPPLAGLSTGGYVMALYNTRCVRRSNALTGWSYGRGFRYSESLVMGAFPGAPLAAAMFNAAIAGASRYGGHYLKLIPDGLLARLLPPTGTGYDQGTRGHYRVQTYTRTASGRRYVASMSQHADPGYAATAVLAGQSALALAFDRDRLSPARGVLTPATAMGEVLLARLPAAGVRIEVGPLTADGSPEPDAAGPGPAPRSQPADPT